MQCDERLLRWTALIQTSQQFTVNPISASHPHFPAKFLVLVPTAQNFRGAPQSPTGRQHPWPPCLCDIVDKNQHIGLASFGPLTAMDGPAWVAIWQTAYYSTAQACSEPVN